MDYDEYMRSYYNETGNEIEDYEDYSILTEEQQATLNELEEQRADRDTRVFWQQYHDEYGNTWDS